MLSFKSLDKTATLVLSVLASLVKGQNSKTSFTLHQSEFKPSLQSGPASPLSTYHKFNRRVPENVQNTEAANLSKVIASPSEFDRAYLIPITVGGQTLNLEIDTGADSFWVFSSKFGSLFPSTYNNSISNTSRLQEGYPWSNCYGDGSCVAGDVYTETVNVGGIVVNNQTIGVAKEVNYPGTTHLKGVLGLSFNKNSMRLPHYTTFFDNIKSTLSAPVFTADLKKGVPGSYDFGFIDDSKYTGDITYVPVNAHQGFWEFTLNGYAISTDSFNFTSVNVIADTGTTGLFLPDHIVKAYYTVVPSAFYSSVKAGYIFPCGTTFPSITFNIGNYNAVVPGSYMSGSPLHDDVTTCFGRIQPAIDPGVFVLGDVFLKSQFVVFDAGDNPRIGFAAKPL